MEIRDIFFAYIDNLFSKFSATKIIQVEAGIKPINQIENSDYFKDITIKYMTELKYEQLVCGPDYLKDKYTQFGKSIDKSPYYQLIKYLDNNLPLYDCDYIKRCQNGTLDFRKKSKISTELIKGKYNKRVHDMKGGKIFPIKVYEAYDDTFVIADGRHSLAMAYYFNYSNLRFDIIPNLLFDTYNRWIFEKIKDKDDFKIHNEIYRRSYEYKKTQVNRIIEEGFD